MTATKTIGWAALLDMTERPTTGTVVVDCHRCLGVARAFERHGHVNGGRCLRCNGTLVETMPAGRAWDLAREADQRQIREYAAIERFRAGKAVTLPTIGQVHVVRGDQPGRYVFALVRNDLEADIVHVSVHNGVVSVLHADQYLVERYLTGEGTKTDWAQARQTLRAELQAALRR
jgi:hypothetical protein